MQELVVMGKDNCANTSWEGDAAEYGQVPGRGLVQKAWGKQSSGRDLLCSFSPVKRNHLSMQVSWFNPTTGN